MPKLRYVDAKGDSHSLCVASYSFPKGRIPKPTPHGNSKTGSPFHPTWPSTMQEIKNGAEKYGPKETVTWVSKGKWGDDWCI